MKYVQAQGELHFESGEFFKTISTVGGTAAREVVFYRCSSMLRTELLVLFACSFSVAEVFS